MKQPRSLGVLLVLLMSYVSPALGFDQTVSAAAACRAAEGGEYLRRYSNGSIGLVGSSGMNGQIVSIKCDISVENGHSDLGSIEVRLFSTTAYNRPFISQPYSIEDSTYCRPSFVSAPRIAPRYSYRESTLQFKNLELIPAVDFAFDSLSLTCWLRGEGTRIHSIRRYYD